MDTGSGLFEIEKDLVKQQKFETDIRHIEPKRGRKRTKKDLKIKGMYQQYVYSVVGGNWAWLRGQTRTHIATQDKDNFKRLTVDDQDICE